jgi:hypothetical protein
MKPCSQKKQITPFDHNSTCDFSCARLAVGVYYGDQKKPYPR